MRCAGGAKERSGWTLKHKPYIPSRICSLGMVSFPWHLPSIWCPTWIGLEMFHFSSAFVPSSKLLVQTQEHFHQHWYGLKHFVAGCGVILLASPRCLHIQGKPTDILVVDAWSQLMLLLDLYMMFSSSAFDPSSWFYLHMGHFTWMLLYMWNYSLIICSWLLSFDFSVNLSCFNA